ncbi:MAG: DUF3137 domain-containing protein [Oscillospiraceae bacterium]|nr:DUF3137 domain-containing protein [Oscillospiraceae bacterium]
MNRVGERDMPLPVTDDEIKSRINFYIPKIKRNNIISVILICLGVVIFIFAFVYANENLYSSLEDTLGIALIPSAPVLIVGGAFLNSAFHDKKRLSSYIRGNVVKCFLAERFELKYYASARHILPEKIRWTGLINNWSRIDGSDLTEGCYKGVKFSFSDIHLSTGDEKASVTLFKGQWLILELNNEIPWGVKLRERGIDNKLAKSDVETENIEFNKKFEIKSSDPHTAFYILTPHFMEYILKADKRAQARTYISIDGTQIHVALHSGRDLFEPGEKGMFDIKNIDALRMQVKWDINYITGVIDAFLESEKFFGVSELNQK